MNKMTTVRYLPLLVAVTVSQVLVGCNSDNNTTSEPFITARAIDGYLVGASVFCDGVAAGGTGAAGLLICPPGTGLIHVENGSDVGFDETATSGGIPFVGQLSAPGSVSQLTPLSTLAVAMASDEQGFHADRFDAAVTNLASALGQSSLDLDADASTLMQVVRLNAQLHQILTANSSAVDEYVLATQTLAGVFQSIVDTDNSYDLAQGVEDVMVALNDRLVAGNAPTAVTSEALDRRIEQVKNTNIVINDATSPDPVTVAASSNPQNFGALSVKRDETAIRLFNEWNGYSEVTLDSFEDDTQVNGRYQTVLTDSLEGLAIGNHAFKVARDLDSVRASVGIELHSTITGDRRLLSFTTSDVLLSATEGDSATIEVQLPEGSLIHGRGVNEDGVETLVTIRTTKIKIFRSANGAMTTDFNEIDEALEKEGLGDLLTRSGNYQLTVVLAGIQINELQDGEYFWPDVLSVDAGDGTVTGMGFRGYLTIDR